MGKGDSSGAACAPGIELLCVITPAEEGRGAAAVESPMCMSVTPISSWASQVRLGEDRSLVCHQFWSGVSRCLFLSPQGMSHNQEVLLCDSRRFSSTPVFTNQLFPHCCLARASGSIVWCLEIQLQMGGGRRYLSPLSLKGCNLSTTLCSS